YATPLIREFIDRMILWGVLPQPSQYEVEWPDLFMPTAQEKAQVFKTYAEGIMAVAPPGSPELVITPAEVRTKFLDLEAEPESDLQMPELEPVEPLPMSGNGR